jgi:hypothetical protein
LHGIVHEDARHAFDGRALDVEQLFDERRLVLRHHDRTGCQCDRQDRKLDVFH